MGHDVLHESQLGHNLFLWWEVWMVYRSDDGLYDLLEKK